MSVKIRKENTSDLKICEQFDFLDKLQFIVD